MAFLFHKFQKAVGTLAKSPTFARDPRQLQFEADINRLFLYSSYNRLGREADEADIEEIIDMATKASLADQQQLVQENVHSQIKTFSHYMDEILFSGNESLNPLQSPNADSAPRRSGLSLAVGGGTSGLTQNHSAIPETKSLKLSEINQTIKDRLGYSLALKPSEIPDKNAGQGLFLEGEADVGSVIAIYPGVIYSPAYYRYIPGYPRVDAHNPYLITRYDGTIINAQPWGVGGDAREFWDGTSVKINPTSNASAEKGSDRIWKMLSKPLKGAKGGIGEVLERRNPLAYAHFANHPAKEMAPNVMVCPYDFPLDNKDMRPYVPNLAFGKGEDGIRMRRFGNFWFKSGSSGNDGSGAGILKTLVLIATRALSNEEILLNYRLSNSKRRPEWYTPVDEEEDRRRWG
ncbi:hypothetical protein V2J09_011574 [Rumex salicifolius]